MVFCFSRSKLNLVEEQKTKNMTHLSPILNAKKQEEITVTKRNLRKEGKTDRQTNEIY